MKEKVKKVLVWIFEFVLFCGYFYVLFVNLVCGFGYGLSLIHICISNVPEYYETTHGRKVVDESRNVIDLVKNPNKFSVMIVGIVLVLILIIILLVVLIRKLIKKRRRKKK